MSNFTARLTAPDGSKSEYSVTAKNRTEARQKIGAVYRANTPSARYGFYSFSQHRLIWLSEQD